MKLLIAGGGTGGHLFPALAVAHAMREKLPSAEILFVGTRNGIEAKIIPQTEFSIRFISSRGIRRTGIVNLCKATGVIPLGLVQSISLIREFRPTVVLGVGGYASGPTVAAAILLRVPTAIQEQNSIMGTTNRILSRFVDKIFVSWQTTEPQTSPLKTVFTGNPIRKTLFNPTQTVADDGKFHLLIFGGSRGAGSINQAIMENLDRLAAIPLKIIHQTGAQDFMTVKNTYEAHGIEADVREFISDMGSAYSWADLVVCRAGAGSLSELTAFGKPAIVIPYPYAISDHQMRNAQVLENAGAVCIVKDSDLKAGRLVDSILELMADRSTLQKMAMKSASLGKPEAAELIVNELIRIERSRN